ncbi:ThiF family adenylyltransferase [Aliiglaciecola sp. 2_MG-2023]|uniref:ThiF family adenylyltransferase n=1 Tax=unclassified Aliiglaciecola TaxID=2593648 RepID=UPI0026E28E05|nr:MULTISPECIES: ThiF family adenylyltransferase [unclassified Aliiglaciecola]MDO6709994.1 ThiF family adenylyltransferase [Aliiglaciecola sp. 2_MG-2023]MDO6751142.1 ThiF family adenylyltransferase [Aliiglaciecola sp. 1_MG-2023]
MFDYDKAFSRNIGWVTEEEQLILKTKKIAIAGLGGVGGDHLVTLARLGIQRFAISDFDEFEVHNFNRQAGAYISTLDRPKCQVMKEVCLDINPQSTVDSFEQGIDETNVDRFLEDVDVYVDSLDFFALSARKLVFQKCHDKNIPIVTAAPIGMGSAFLCFMPGKMSYEEYFQFESCNTENEQLIKFMIGLTPKMLQMKYLVDESRADFNAKKGPSTPMGVKLCSGVAETNVLKILLGRGKVLCAPKGLHFDAYRNTLVKTWLPFGNKGLLQRLIFNIAKKKLL